MRNASLKFICRDVTLRVEGEPTPVTRGLAGQTLAMPVAHAEGNYFADPETLDRLEGEGRVVFRYVDVTGKPTDAANPNGSMRNIAGVANESGTIVGLMPHPERAMEPLLGGTDGKVLFESLFAMTNVSSSPR